MTNIAIFASGNGTNCENIIRYFKDSHDIQVALVVANNPNAYVLKRAEQNNVPSMVVSKSQINSEEYIFPLLKQYEIKYIILAGFLLMIPAFIIRSYENRIINIHPSLLPKFGGKGMYGRHVHEAVKESDEEETGITIHYVNEACDGGDIIAQFRTNLSTLDNVEDIEKKIHLLEQKHFPRVIERVIVSKENCVERNQKRTEP